MNENLPIYNRLDEDSFFAIGREQLWFNAKEVTPELTLNASELIDYLRLNGVDLDDNLLKRRKDKISRLILTVGRYDTAPFGAHYEIGFFDGERFCQLDGYRIYPDPTHWMPLLQAPKSLVLSSSLEMIN